MSGTRTAAWTDCHNHLHLYPDADARVAVMARAGIWRGVANAVGEADWQALEGLAGRWPEQVIPAFGIHPWQAAEVAAGWEGRLAGMLERHPAALVGECGLDGAVGVDMEAQRRVFAGQMRLAAAMGRPMCVHAARAWGELREAVARGARPGRWLVHAFGGSYETARELAAMGAWFSVGPWVLEPRRARALEVLRRLPRDRVLLESDAFPGRGPAPEEMAGFGIRLAAALGGDVVEFSSRLEENAGRWLAREQR